MPLNTIDPHEPASRGARLRARLAIAAVAALVTAVAVAVVVHRTPDTEPQPPEEAAIESSDDPADDLMRPSEQVDDPEAEEAGEHPGPASDATADGAPVEVGLQTPADTTRQRSDDPPNPRPGSTGSPDLPAADPPGDPTSNPDGDSPTGPSGGPADDPSDEPVADPSDEPVETDDGSDPVASDEAAAPPPFYLPGPGSAPVLGPLRPRDDSDDEPAPPVEVEEPVEEIIVAKHQPEAPDRDEEDCPQLDLYPIGGYTEDAPAHFADLSPRFRALAEVEWAKVELVCGHAMEPWRDLVIQRLVTDGAPDGAMITAADGSSIVMRLTEIEWVTYKFRYVAGPVGPNLVGYPVGRLFWGSLSIIRTTAGGLVFDHPEAMGVPLIGGAWDFWEANDGPNGFMGVPVGKPESATGPIGADTWSEGLPSSGARQEFTEGWLFLPGVLTDVEAAAQPMSRYEWHDASELGPMPSGPIDYRGHIMQISGISFYVDKDGVRHWIRTTSDWSCAHWDLGATEYEVRGFELASYPLGDEFVCSRFK